MEDILSRFMSTTPIGLLQLVKYHVEYRTMVANNFWHLEVQECTNKENGYCTGIFMS